MPRYSQKSKYELSTCHELLQRLFNEVIKHFDCTVLEGRRGKSRQNQMYDQGASQVKWPDSSHNRTPSDAVDVAPYYAERPHIRDDQKSLKRWYYFAGVVRGIASQLNIPVRWGGDWDGDTYVTDQKFHDLAHWELLASSTTSYSVPPTIKSTPSRPSRSTERG